MADGAVIAPEALLWPTEASSAGRQAAVLETANSREGRTLVGAGVAGVTGPSQVL